MKLPQQNKKAAINSKTEFLTVFGSGCDIIIYENSDKDNQSYCYINDTYKAPMDGSIRVRKQRLTLLALIIFMCWNLKFIK